jgi:hypothetical protein
MQDRGTRLCPGPRSACRPPIATRPAQTSASLADLPWWAVFDDPTLQGLITRTLANNLDLQVSVARIAQARALVGVSASQSQAAAGLSRQCGRGVHPVADRRRARLRHLRQHRRRSRLRLGVRSVGPDQALEPGRRGQPAATGGDPPRHPAEPDQRGGGGLFPPAGAGPRDRHRPGEHAHLRRHLRPVQPALRGGPRQPPAGGAHARQPRRVRSADRGAPAADRRAGERAERADGRPSRTDRPGQGAGGPGPARARRWARRPTCCSAGPTSARPNRG